MSAPTGVLRVRFTPVDVLRTRLVTAPDPMWELVLSLHALRAGPGSPHAGWRSGAVAAIRDRRLTGLLSMLFVLVPASGRFPDFLTPPGAEEGIDAALEAMLCMPKQRIASDVAAAYDHRHAPGWLRLLAGGDRQARGEMVGALRAYYEAVLAPHWPAVRRAVSADRALRADAAVTSGPEQLFAGLPAPLRWHWPVLTTEYSEHRTIDLRGRGLTLVPSYFCTGWPVSLIDPDLPPVLVYSATPPDRGDAAGAVVARLTPALGQTRARVLCALGSSLSTSELAQRINMSLASASQQAAALRAAGLIATTRSGSTMRHARTELGDALVAGQLA